MLGLIKRYAHWLHLQWPAGEVEKLPDLDEHGQTNIPGIVVVGDLTGIPLLKFAVDSGTKAIRNFLKDPQFQFSKDLSIYDVAIIGAGVSGMAAALEANRHGLRCVVIEASEPFSTIVNFPKQKPIYAYPANMIPEGTLYIEGTTKEMLLEELLRQTKNQVSVVNACAEFVRRKKNYFEVALQKNTTSNQTLIPSSGVTSDHQDKSNTETSIIKALRIVVALGRSGQFKKLGVPGENLNKVYNRLHDPKDFFGQHCLVVGGGDSALETAIALTKAGAIVTLSYRKNEFSRAKTSNIELLSSLVKDASKLFQQQGSLSLLMNSRVEKISNSSVLLKQQNQMISLQNDVVFTMIGREAPLDFFRKSKIELSAQWSWKHVASLVLFLVCCVFIYHWKKTGLVGFDSLPLLNSILTLGDTFLHQKWFPYNLPTLWPLVDKPLLRTLQISLSEPGFYYSSVYSGVVVIFGIKRIRRRKTPYITAQTLTLAALQVGPLFFLPYIALPWLGARGFFDDGLWRTIADHLFPIVSYGHGREYWRSFGFILAWPLFFWNVFTQEPLWAWLIISVIQTGIIIPIMIYFWGKGAYCGWICSCGALAETWGDNHRHKMPHGRIWNRLNMAGQLILAWAIGLLILRILSWNGVTWAQGIFDRFFYMSPVINYVWFVDLLLAGIVGVGLYFHFSGRVWCRFFCPLAALMHIYARFSRFRIFSDKKKCISCNMCTSVCHQGIDIMSVANKGLPMNDPQCVRCSACVQSCPTGCLHFGQSGKNGDPDKRDSLAAHSLHNPLAKSTAELNQY